MDGELYIIKEITTRKIIVDDDGNLIEIEGNFEELVENDEIKENVIISETILSNIKLRGGK